MVGMHFWMQGVFFEPQYSYSRKMLTQLFTIVSILDDLTITAPQKKAVYLPQHCEGLHNFLFKMLKVRLVACICLNHAVCVQATGDWLPGHPP
jgi:hypothetical protein